VSRRAGSHSLDVGERVPQHGNHTGRTYEESTGDLRQRVLAALELQPGPHRPGEARPAFSEVLPGSVQPIPGEALLSSVILSILLTLAVGSVSMLQLAAWPSARRGGVATARLSAATEAAPTGNVVGRLRRSKTECS
jgi:hypothetical protein